MFHKIFSLIQLDLKLELRNKHLIFSLLLYIFSTILLINLMAGEIDSERWNVFYWIVQTFVCINAVSKPFTQLSAHQFVYLQNLTNGQNFIISKLIYAGLFQLLLAIISYVIFVIFFGNPLANSLSFLIIALCGSVLISILFTFLTAIAHRAQQNMSIVPIMGFPLVTPLLMIINKISTAAAKGSVLDNLAGIYLILGVFAALLIVLCIVLYPIVWEE